MRNKSEVFEKFKELETITTNDCGQRIGTCIQIMKASQYVSTEFKNYLKRGIKQELTVLYSPQQNGVSERLN